MRYDTIYAACRAWDSGTSLPASTTVTLPATAQRFLLKLSWVELLHECFTLFASLSVAHVVLYCCRRCLSHTLSVYVYVYSPPRPVAWHRPRLICLLFCYETKLCQGQIYMNTLSAGDVCLCSCAAWLAGGSAECGGWAIALLCWLSQRFANIRWVLSSTLFAMQIREKERERESGRAINLTTHIVWKGVKVHRK